MSASQIDCEEALRVVEANARIVFPCRASLHVFRKWRASLHGFFFFVLLFLTNVLAHYLQHKTWKRFWFCLTIKREALNSIKLIFFFINWFVTVTFCWRHQKKTKILTTFPMQWLKLLVFYVTGAWCSLRQIHLTDGEGRACYIV